MTDFTSALLTTKQFLLSEIQTHGLRLGNPAAGSASRVGGAGPTDHKAVTIMGTTIMVPVHTRGAIESLYFAAPPDEHGSSELMRGDEVIGKISFPPAPKFYALKTEEGIPFWKIAQLHSRDTLATTVLQTCIRYGESATKCQFCAIGESLKTGRTIAKKTPEQLARVAAAAQELDGIRNVVLTTGTPATPDRGASVLTDVAYAIKERTDLPTQAQCEPPADFSWFSRMHGAGVDSLGMHLEAWDENVRKKIMPGKAEVPVSFYLEAFVESVKVFGRAQVSTYLLAGLGDSKESLLEAARTLIDLGVYPFIVPFVPVTGTPLAGSRPPTAEFMRSVLQPVGEWLAEAGMTSDTVKAGCVKCAACTTLSTFEKKLLGRSRSTKPMPEINLIVRLPDGIKMECYSPSTVIRDYFKPGEVMPMTEFVKRSKVAFNHASERVRARYGYGCISAMMQLDEILAANQRYPEQGNVEIIST